MRFLNPGSFAIVLLCFLLPFTNLQCNQNKLVSFTGVELVKGTSVKEKISSSSMGGMFGGMGGMSTGQPDNGSDEKIMEIPLLICAIILLAVGIITSVLTIKNKNPRVIIKWAIAGHALALLALLGEIVKLEYSMMAVNDKMAENAGGIPMSIKFSWGMEIGFWLVIIIPLGFIIYNIKELRKTPPVLHFGDNTPPAPPFPDDGTTTLSQS